MSGLSQRELEEVRLAQQEYFSRGGKIHRMPIHAPSTGAMRFNYGRRDYKARQEQKAIDAMDATREQWNREMGFQQEAKNAARGYEGD